MTKLDDWEFELMKDFFHNMQVRLEEGRDKYNMDYLTKDNLREMEAELFDIANYALLQWIRLKKIRK